MYLKSDFKAPQNDSTDLFHYFLDLKVHFIKDFKMHTHTYRGREKKPGAPVSIVGYIKRFAEVDDSIFKCRRETVDFVEKKNINIPLAVCNVNELCTGK